MTTSTQRPLGAPVSRRTLLAGVAAGVVATVGCSARPTSTAPPTRSEPSTVASLTSDRPFYIAHRGGGGDWPEMTGYAYEQASRLPGLQALEISVCISADGVLVCSHDPTTERVGGVPYTIADETWETLSSVQVSAATTVDPSQPSRPLTRFEDVAEAYADRFVLFVEPKVPAAAAPLMARLAALGQPERVVWKQYVNSGEFVRAKEHGFSTWGYVLNQPSHLGTNLTRYAAADYLDMLGAPNAEATTLVSEVVTAATRQNKPTIMWPISTSADRDRALRLGCAGLMTSRITELLATA